MSEQFVYALQGDYFDQRALDSIHDGYLTTISFAE